ncbi:MAG TPA: hypothetical protein VHW90_03600 [Stellaceae bacterium]|jgi:hypothetical protein|nr:hypothetical protein [Stellaceae bacterium]
MTMRWVAAAALVLAVGALAPVAHAEGPRASSGNNWSGMGPPAAAVPVYAVATPTAAPAPRYVWEEGYDHGGKWHGHWTLVQ